MRASFLTVLGFIILIVGGATLAFSPRESGFGSTTVAIAVYLGEVLGVAAVVIGLGVQVTKRFGGFALTGQCTYSLAKVQMAGWTVLVIATLFTAAEIRIFGYFGSVTDPLNIRIPGELLSAMGIAVFTTAATPALLSLKTTGTPTEGQADAAAQRMAAIHSNTTTNSFNNTGSLMTRQDPSLARWSDLIAGEEVGNAGTMDLSKVQQLLVTILLLGTYAALMIELIANKGTSGVIAVSGTSAATVAAEAFASLPVLSQSFVGLLAISHAGYLGYKAIPKPATENSTQPKAAPQADGGAM
jgi:hypothetical protein